MPVCPECGTENEPQAAFCLNCRTALTDSPQEPDAAGDNAGLDLTELARFSTVAEAEMVKELLEQNEIRTVLTGETDPIGTVSGATPIALLVEERDLQKGKELCEAYFSGSDFGEIPDDQES
jgi:hypothetical protein